MLTQKVLGQFLVDPQCYVFVGQCVTQMAISVWRRSTVEWAWRRQACARGNLSVQTDSGQRLGISASSTLRLSFRRLRTSALSPVHARKRAPVPSDRICPHTEKRTQRRKSTTQAIERTSRHSSHTLLPLKTDVAATRSGRSAGRRAVIPQHTLPSFGGITCCVVHNVVATPSARLPSSWPPLQLANSVGVNNWYPEK